MCVGRSIAPLLAMASFVLLTNLQRILEESQCYYKLNIQSNGVIAVLPYAMRGQIRHHPPQVYDDELPPPGNILAKSRDALVYLAARVSVANHEEARLRAVNYC